jgi:hypothetical protein
MLGQVVEVVGTRYRVTHGDEGYALTPIGDDSALVPITPEELATLPVTVVDTRGLLPEREVGARRFSDATELSDADARALFDVAWPPSEGAVAPRASLARAIASVRTGRTSASYVEASATNVAAEHVDAARAIFSQRLARLGMSVELFRGADGAMSALMSGPRPMPAELQAQLRDALAEIGEAVRLYAETTPGAEGLRFDVGAPREVTGTMRPADLSSAAVPIDVPALSARRDAFVRACDSRGIPRDQALRLFTEATGVSADAFPEVAAPRTTPLSPESATRIVGGARFPERPSDSAFGRVTPAMIATAGAMPVESMTVNGVTFHLSEPFDLGSGRLGVVAFIERDGVAEAHILYRSNSQAMWRVCPFSFNDAHYGKGIGESDTMMPIEVTMELHRMSAEGPIPLRDPETGAAPAVRPGDPASPASRLFYGLVERGFIADSYGEQVHMATAPLWPRRPGVAPELRTGGGGTGVNPAALADISSMPPGLLPNLSHEVASFTYENPRYAAINGGNGTLTGHVFASADGTLRYCFVEDSEGRASLASVERADGEITSYGTNAEVYNLEGMDEPLMEYAMQVPREYGGSPSSAYMRNFRYCRELPIIRFYYESLGRSIAEVPN